MKQFWIFTLVQSDFRDSSIIYPPVTYVSTKRPLDCLLKAIDQDPSIRTSIVYSKELTQNEYEKLKESLPVHD